MLNVEYWMYEPEEIHDDISLHTSLDIRLFLWPDILDDLIHENPIASQKKIPLSEATYLLAPECIILTETEKSIKAEIFIEFVHFVQFIIFSIEKKSDRPFDLRRWLS